MRCQIRSPSGQSCWDLSAYTFEEVPGNEMVYPDRKWVKWDEHEWLMKSRPCAICEIAGYQLAQTLDLPLQPWLAFYRSTGADRRGTPNHLGVLIERWAAAKFDCHIIEPSGTHQELVAKALALAVFNRDDWPSWLMNQSGSELRIFDLEFVGPMPTWPPQYTHFHFYRSSTASALDDAHKEAAEAGILDVFLRHLQTLVDLDISSVLAVGGHPNAEALERFIVFGIQLRQRRLRQLL